MPRFTYIAIDRNGRESSGMLDASSAAEAGAMLKARGLYPAKLDGEAQLAGSPPAIVRGFAASRRKTLFRERVSSREMATFLRQMASLLKAGMPAVHGLDVLARQEGNATLRAIMTGIAADVRAGASLFDAFSRHDAHFDRLSLNLIRAGEAAGALDVVLDRLARFSEKNLALRARISAAMVYPLVVMGVAASILCGLMIFVVPKFQQIFADLLKGAPLPPLTQAVLSVSHAIRDHWLLAAGSALAAIAALRTARRRPEVERVGDAVLARVPLLGPLRLKSHCVRFARTFGTLLSGGVPILDALAITQSVAGSQRVTDAIGAIHERVKAGDSVARSVESTAVFPPMVASMIEVGEQTGELGEMLNRIAEIYEDEVDRTAANLSSLVEPMLIFALAIIVGTIVIALFLPIVRMVQLLS